MSGAANDLHLIVRSGSVRALADASRLDGMRWEALKPSGKKNHEVRIAVGMKIAKMPNSK